MADISVTRTCESGGSRSFIQFIKKFLWKIYCRKSSWSGNVRHRKFMGSQARERMEGEQVQESTEKELLIDVALLKTGFSPQPDGQLLIDGYLDAYTEMNKFFQVLGTLFQVVSSDVHSKVQILRGYRSGGEGDNYHSIQSMIAYEKEHELLITKNRPSGARTLLRLHRALEFVAEFLALLMDNTIEGSLGKKVSELYSCTLGKFHGTLLRTTFSGALLWIPRRETIIDRLTNGSDEAEKVAYAEMPRVIEMMKAMYDHTQKYYEEEDLLDLP